MLPADMQEAVEELSRIGGQYGNGIGWREAAKHVMSLAVMNFESENDTAAAILRSAAQELQAHAEKRITDWRAMSDKRDAAWKEVERLSIQPGTCDKCGN